MADKGVEVKTKLTLDNQSKGAMEAIRRDFKATDNVRKEVQSGFGDFAREVAAMALGLNLVPMARKIMGLATSSFVAADAANLARRSMAGLTAGMDDVPWDDAIVSSTRLYRENQNLAIELGKSKNELNAGVTAMTTFLGGGAQATAAAQSGLRGMAEISNVLGISVEEIGSQVGKMASGFVSAEMKMYNLLKSTKIFHSDITKLQPEWQKLTEEERLRRLTSAINQVAGKLERAAPTMANLSESAAEFATLLQESFGDEVLKSLIPVLLGLKGDLVGSKEEIRRYAQILGREVGRWVTEAAAKMKDGFQYIKTHAEEIKQAIIDAMSFARDTVSWILAHKEELAIAFGAKMLGAGKLLGPLASGAAGVFGAGAGTAGAGMAAQIGMGTASMLGAGGLVSAGGTAGGVAALGGLAVAAGATALAMWGLYEVTERTIGSKTAEAKGVVEATKYFKELENQTKMGKGFAARDKYQLDQEAQQRNALTNYDGAKGLGENSAALGEWADNIAKLRAEGRRMVDESEASVPALEKMVGAEQRLSDQLAKVHENANKLSAQHVQQEESKLLATMEVLMNDQSVVTNAIASEYMAAVRSGNTGAQEYIASLIKGSDAMYQAFVSSADMTSDAFSMLAEQVKDRSSNFYDMLMGKVDAMARAAKNPESPKISMSGGQTFKVQQDFRNEDPDRIAVIFQKGVVRSIENRIQASTASPFGT